MKKLFAIFVVALFSLTALAQTYPSPTFSSLTLQNPLTAANGGTGSTTSTGTGSAVLSNSPILTGNVSVPNRGAGDSTSNAASTAFVYGSLASPLIGIGSTAPNSGAFTTLSASGAVSGAGFTSLLTPYAPLASPTFIGTVTIPTANIAGGAINGASIGATTPFTGAFTTLSSTAAPTIGTATIYPTVPTKAALQGLSTATVSTVTRLGFYAAGDAPPLTYAASASACSLNSGAGDNGSQVLSADGKCWLANFPASGADVREYGAKGDGTTDDYAAITSALNNSPATILLPPKAFRVSAGITIPIGKALRGEYPGVYGSGAITDSAPMIIGDLSVSIIVTVTGGGFTEGVALANVMVNRAAGTVPANSASVFITNSSNNLTVQDVLAMRSAIGFSVGGGASTSLGIHLLRCYTGQVTQYHLQISNAVETTVTESRFGRNGGGDVTATAYVNINGPTVDTVRFIADQFNQSGASVGVVLAFTGYANNPNGIISFSMGHMEGWSTAVISADAGSTSIKRLKFAGCSINGTGSFYAGAAANLQEFMLTGNTIDGAVSLTLDQQTSSIVTGNTISGAVVINQGTQVATGNYFAGNVTLQGSSTKTVFVGNAIGGTLSNTMTGTTAIANNI